MTDWISAIVFIVLAFLWSPLAAAIILRTGMTDDTQHRIDAARLEGIRLGLEVAEQAALKAEDTLENKWRAGGKPDNYLEGRFNGMGEAAYLIRNLNPDTIAKEAQND